MNVMKKLLTYMILAVLLSLGNSITAQNKVKTYVITETGNYSDDDAKNRVEEAIKYKPFQKVVKFDDDDEECIVCPNCNQKILSFFTIDTLCPKCGSNFSLDYEVLMD